MNEILPMQHKTSINQSINQSNNYNLSRPTLILNANIMIYDRDFKESLIIFDMYIAL